MGEAHSGGGIRRRGGFENPKVAAGAAGLLSIAASPTFAVMALLTGVVDAGTPGMLCSATQHAAPLNGMTIMYLLMSAFHLAPWLRLISNRLSVRVADGRGTNRSNPPAICGLDATNG